MFAFGGCGLGCGDAVAAKASNDLSRNEGKATTDRGLTLQDLLTKCGHYAPTVRKEAVVGLRNFFQLHPAELQQPATLLSLLEAVCLRVSDDAHAVRHAVLLFLESFVEVVP